MFSILIAFVLIYIVDVFFNFIFRNAEWGIYKKLHQIIEEKNYYDTWIIGSSRAETAFETNILAQKSNLKIFNAGIHGAKPPQTYYLLKHIFQTHPLPKLLVFDIDVHNISDKDSILNIEQFAPFAHHHQLRSNFATIDKRIDYAYVFPMYELSFYGLRGLSKLVRIIFNQPGRYDTAFQYSGCYHSHTEYQKDHYSDTTHPFKFHSVNISFMDSVIERCKKNKLELVFTVSPIFNPDTNIINAVNALKKYCSNKGIYLYDFSDMQNISYDISKFSDKYHLKFNGSVEFSSVFADSLNCLLHKSTKKHK